MLRSKFGIVVGALLTGLLLGSAPGVADTTKQPVRKKALLESTIAELTGKANRSINGLDLPVILEPAKANARHRFLIQGGLHGNEAATVEFVRWVQARYARGISLLNRLAVHDVAIDFLPVANPDGYRQLSRYNDRGVNLNRNFGVLFGISRENPGKAAASEPETKAIKDLFRLRKYTAAIDVHGYINWIVGPSTPEHVKEYGNIENPAQAQVYDKWTDVLRRETKALKGYRYHTAMGLGDGGAFEDWAYWQANALAACLEMKSPERYVQTSFPRLFGRQFKALSNHKVDLFARYERFIMATFENAIRISNSRDTTLATTEPQAPMVEESMTKSSH